MGTQKQKQQVGQAMPLGQAGTPGTTEPQDLPAEPAP